MRKKAFDRRFIYKMQELNRSNGMTYTKLADKLRIKGHNLTHIQVFEIAARRREADKALQNDIADILGCLRKDIF